jgi:hypothetical protein
VSLRRANEVSEEPQHALLQKVFRLVVGLLQIGATAAIAIVVYRQTNRLKKIELTKQAIDVWNFANSVALSRDENLLAFDSIGREATSDPIEVRRKRWCAFIWLVALEATFVMQKEGMIDKKSASQTLKHSLELILVDDLVYSLVLERGYDPEFVALCESVRKEVMRIHSQRGIR